MVIQVWEDMLISDLRALIACRLHASPDQCYVTKGWQTPQSDVVGS